MGRRIVCAATLCCVTAALVLTPLGPSTALAQDPDALWRAGQQALQNGDYRGCVDNMRAALQSGGEAYDRWGWLHMVLGACLGPLGQYDEAISELQAALELISEDSERWSANNSLAQVYVARGNSGDYDLAIDRENEAGKYATTASQRTVHSKTLGQAYYFKEDWRNAIRHLGEAATSRNTDADVAAKLGRAYLEAGDSDQARTWFEKTLTLDRANVGAITNLGRLYLIEANWLQAVRYLEQAVGLDPQNMQIRNMLDRAYLGSSSHEDAAAVATQQRTWRRLVVAPENRCAPYDADDYPYPQSVEAQIVAELGGVYGPYTGTWFASQRETDIEHIVARSEAHDSGLCAVDDATKRRFASDLLNLTLASPGINRNQKRDRDAAEWLPDLNRCWFAERIVAVRQRYSLTIDHREADALERVLSTCSSTALVVRPGTPTHTAPSNTPAQGKCGPYRNCTALRLDHPSGVGREHCAYQSRMDRDNDGRACEQ